MARTTPPIMATQVYVSTTRGQQTGSRSPVEEKADGSLLLFIIHRLVKDILAKEPSLTKQEKKTEGCKMLKLKFCLTRHTIVAMRHVLWPLNYFLLLDETFLGILNEVRRNSENISSSPS